MNGLNLNETELLSRYGRARDIDIDRLLTQYSTSLADVREMFPQLTKAVSQRRKTTTFPTQPMFFTATEAAEMGLPLEEGWMLKMTPAEGNGGYTSSFITPQKWEITENDLYISPSGDKLSRADMEALLGEPTGGFEATPWAVTIENLTEEGKIAYQEYQEDGGELDVSGWVDLRERQQLETEEVFGAVFPEQDISEVITYMNEQPEAFLEDIREIGPTEEMVRFLKSLEFKDKETGNPIYLTDTDIQELFGTTPVPEVVPPSTETLRIAAPFPKTPVWATHTTAPDFGVFIPESYKDVSIVEVVPVKDAAYVFGGSIKQLPSQIGASVLQAIQGQSGASVVNKDWADEWIAEANKDLNKFVQEVAAQYPNSAFLLDIAQLSQNIAYSVTAMGPGVLASLPLWLAPEPTTGTKIAAAAITGAVSGYVSYRMVTYQVTQLYLEYKDSEKREQTGEGLTLEEENKLKEDFHDDAVKYGLWEAVPEGISNMLFSGILGGAFNNAFAKVVGKEAAEAIGASLIGRVGAKALGIYGEEILTETITQKGQAAIEAEAGLREGTISWLEAFKEVAPQTFLLTTVMAGAGQTIISSRQAVNKIRNTLRQEIGETNPLYGELEQGIEVGILGRINQIVESWEAEKGPAPQPVIPEMAENVLQEIEVMGKAAEKVAPTIPEITTGQPYTATVYRGYKVEGTPVDEGLFGKGTYYTTNKEYAETYDGKEVMTVNLKNPFVIQTQQEYEDFQNETTRPVRQKALNEGKTVQEADELAARAAREWLESRGHDGLIARNIIEKGDEVVVFEPEKAMGVPKAEAGMPEVGLQPSMLEEVPAKEIRPEARGKLVQSRLDDYLRLREYNKERVTDRISEIKKALETKGRLPKELGLKGNLRLELARLEALQEVEAIESVEELDHLIKQVSEEIGLREMPYAGYGGKAHIDLLRSPTHQLFKGYSLRQLEEMLNVYQQARQRLSPEIPATSVIKAEDIPTDIPALTNTQLTPIQIQKTVDLFKEAVAAPTIEAQRAAAIELRKHIFAQRAKAASESAEAMIAEGMNPEEAIKAAEQMFMTGKLPDVTTDYFNDLTQEMRNVLFAKIYNYWKGKPEGWTEIMAGYTALTNALAGQSIPRVKGIGTRYFPDGGSAWDRLARVFIGDEELLEALDKGKSLSNIIEGIYLETGRVSLPLNQDTVNWLKELSTINEEDRLLLEKPLSEITQVEVNHIAQTWFWERRNELNTLLRDGVISEQEYKLEIAVAKDRVFPHKPTEYVIDPTLINGVFEQLPLMKLSEKQTISKVLKGLGWNVVDINNMLRGIMASFDASFPRQGKYLMCGHPHIAYTMGIAFWKSFNTAEAEAIQQRIMQDPLMELYEDIRKEYGFDFLRIMGVQKGTAQWRAAEEYGYPTTERLLPRITQKVTAPFERIFVTPLNVGSWTLYKDKYKEVMRYAEKVASGQIKLKEGESVDIRKEMSIYQEQIGNLVQRASLGQYNKLGPILNTMFFAARSKLARFFFPLGLTGIYRRGGEWHFSRSLMKETWRDFMITNALISGVVLFGDFMDWWEAEKDPRNAEFMSIRIGNMRIDPWAGYRQFLVLYTRLATGTGVSSVTGAEYEADPIKTLINFLRGSLAPVPSILWDFWTGRNFLGVVVDLTNAEQWIQRIAPFAVQDIWEAFDEGTREGMIAIIPAIFGEGVQTYTGDWRENWAKLGLPKYPENTGYGITEPAYDLADFWADTASSFRGVDPSELTESKGFPEYVRSIAEALRVIESIELLPNKRLASLNADLEEGTTFQQYYQMWQEREKIVASGDEEKLKEFDSDERTRNAYLGNMSQAQYALLMEYHSLPEGEQAEFLGNHPEIYANTREDWLRSHPEENALLALWDKAKIYSLEALDKMNSLAKSLGIPENAIVFEELNEVTQLRIKNDKLFDLLDAYGGLDDEIKDDEGLTARDRAIEQLYEDNPEFRNDQRRIDALGEGTEDNPTPEDIVEGWVDRGIIVDEYGANSAEAKLWLLDNREAHQWALDHALLTDDGSDWNEPILRLLVQYREDFDLHEAYGDISSDRYISDDDQRAEARSRLLFNVQGNLTSFGKAYYTREALSQGYSEGNWNSFVEHVGLPIWGSWRERFLMDNPSFYKEYTNPEIGNHPLVDTSKIKPIARDKIYQQFYDEFQAWDETGGMAPRAIELMRDELDEVEKGGLTFKEARYSVQAYDVGFPENLIDDYVEWYSTSRKDYEDDWWLMEHEDFYKKMYELGLWTEKRDFSKVPTREVWNLYQTYLGLPSGTPRYDYRAKHLDLDAWLVSAKGYTPIGGRGSAGAPSTPWEELGQVKRFQELFK